MSEKSVCRECGWRGKTKEVLCAANPFDSAETVLGCPHCREVNSMRTVCDVDGCWEQDDTGTPTPTGYRRTCWDHRPPMQKRVT